MSEEIDEIPTESIEAAFGVGGTEVAVGSAEDEETAGIEIPDELPVLPLKNTVLFPALLAPLLVKSSRSKRLIDEVVLSPQRLLMCAAVRRPVEGSPGPDDVYRTGTVLRITKMLKFPDDSYRLLVQGIARVEACDFVAEEPYLRASVRLLEEMGDPESVETTALARNLSQQFGALVAESARLSDELQILAANLEDPGKLSDLVGSNLAFDVARKQSILEELNVETRLKRVLDEVARERDAMKVESEIREKVQTDIGKTQREYMLRQQLEAIRHELGESEDSETETERLRERVLYNIGSCFSNHKLRRFSQWSHFQCCIHFLFAPFCIHLFPSYRHGERHVNLC